MSAYKVGGIALPDAPIMIGAGVCKNSHTTREWLTTAPVVSGSYTPEQRDGNQGDWLFYPDTLEELLRIILFGLNSFGMPNVGFKTAAHELADSDNRQPLIVSVAGFSVDDYMNGVANFETVSAVKAIELNFGCPNTEHGKIMSFDLKGLEELFSRLPTSMYITKPIWVKFSPYSDPGLLKEIAAIVSASAMTVKAVVTCNTFPSAYAGKNAISPMGGLAGLSGPALKPIALGQVVQFRQHLRSEVDVIGVGGIATGNDIIDFLDAGARAVQLTSFPFWLGSPGYFWETLMNPETGDRLNKFLGL